MVAVVMTFTAGNSLINMDGVLELDRLFPVYDDGFTGSRDRIPGLG